MRINIHCISESSGFKRKALKIPKSHARMDDPMVSARRTIDKLFDLKI